MISPALEILRQVPAAAAVVVTAWLFLQAQRDATREAREHATMQTESVLAALAATTESLSSNTRAMARVELLLDQISDEPR